MSATAGQAQDQRDLAGRLGIKPGQVVQEIGYDDDCDEQIRDSIAAVQEVELVDEDFDDVVDVVLLWWRDGDGDLVDALVDVTAPLADGGYIWLLTPKSGRDGHVEPSEIGEAAPTAGLSQTSTRERREGLVGHAAGRAEGAPLTRRSRARRRWTPGRVRTRVSDAGGRLKASRARGLRLTPVSTPT